MIKDISASFHGFSNAWNKAIELVVREGFQFLRKPKYYRSLTLAPLFSQIYSAGKSNEKLEQQENWGNWHE